MQGMAASYSATESSPHDAQRLFSSAIAEVIKTKPGGEADTLYQLLEIIKNNTEVSEPFCCELVDSLTTSISSISARSTHHARGKAFSYFHQLRVTKLPSIWGKFEEKLGLPHTKAVLMQSVNRYIFNEVLLQHFTTTN